MSVVRVAKGSLILTLLLVRKAVRNRPMRRVAQGPKALCGLTGDSGKVRAEVLPDNGKARARVDNALRVRVRQARMDRWDNVVNHAPMMWL